MELNRKMRKKPASKLNELESLKKKLKAAENKLKKSQPRPTKEMFEGVDISGIDVDKIISSDSFSKSKTVESLIPYLEEFSEGGGVAFVMQNGSPVPIPYFSHYMEALSWAQFIHIWSGCLLEQLSNNIVDNELGPEFPPDGNWLEGEDE